MRLFFALPLPPDLGEAMGRWQRGHAGSEGWSRPEGLHLTLAFLGERTVEALIPLETVAAGVAHRHRSFDLRTANLGGFPTGERARVLWLGVEPSPALEGLAADLRHSLAEAGEAFDAKAFRAHLTLARFRHARPVNTFAAPPPAAFPARALVLFESRPQGCYTPLRTWNFRGV